MRLLLLLSLVISLFATGSATGAPAAKLERIGIFDSPTYLTAPSEDKSRVFVVEQAGLIKVRVGGRVSTFLNIKDRVQSGGERGLLSMAFDPRYRSSGLFYVYYTDRQGDIRVEEYRRGSPNRANASSRRLVLEIEHRRFSNHNGGQLQFGPDGFLYIGTGDGGGGGDPLGNAQNRNSLLGKILRIDPRKSGARRYRVPASNPYKTGKRAVWASGFRNPWRFSFDRITGGMTITDVGQDAFEEINWARKAHFNKGKNFGWNCREGFKAFSSCTPANYRRPKLAKSHSKGFCSITGGYVVRDRRTNLYGRYIYGDICLSNLRVARIVRGRVISQRITDLRISTVSSFGEDARGRVYALSLGGAVYRIDPR